LHRVSSFLSVLMLCLLLVVAHLLPCSGLLGATSLVHGGRAATRAQSSAASGNTLQSSSMNSLQSSSMNGVQSSSMNNMQASSQNNLQSSSMNNMQSSNMNSMQASNQNSLQLSSASSNTFQSNSANSLQVGTSTRFRAGVASKLSSYLEYGYTPEERMALHAEKYEKEFVIELNMTLAHETGESIGAQLNMDTDFTPVSVLKIRKNGLLEGWNQAHPEDQVLIGDEIIKVNDILWHHNSRTFVERIKGQLQAAKESRQGARRVVTLAIQRPRHRQEVRYQTQRLDLHQHLYSKEFVANISLERGHEMGWELNTTVDWVPVSVQKLQNTGLVALWNQEHPEFRIYPGDEILRVNHIEWHHNSKAFEGRILSQLRHVKQKRPMSLHIRRPRSVVEEVENRSFDRFFSVTLPWTDEMLPLGCLQSDTMDPAGGGSAIRAWNEANPAKRLAVGDCILGVNRERSRPGDAGSKYRFVDAAGPRAGGSRRPHSLTMLVSRSTGFSYTRGWLAEVPARVGQSLGLQTNATDDGFPVTIQKIRALGAVAVFNEDHPEDALAVGDQIFKVNDVLWRSDSREFQRRLQEQFARSRRSGTVRLWVQRPAGVDPGAEGSEDYMEFSVELPVTSSKPMGWDFDITNKQAPVSIRIVFGFGTVSDWNRDNPMKDIQAGDIIMQVGDNIWHNNTHEFMQRFNKQLSTAAATSRKGGKGTLWMQIRRPFRAPSRTMSEGKEKLGEGDVFGAEE